MQSHEISRMNKTRYYKKKTSPLLDFDTGYFAQKKQSKQIYIQSIITMCSPAGLNLLKPFKLQ